MSLSVSKVLRSPFNIATPPFVDAFVAINEWTTVDPGGTFNNAFKSLPARAEVFEIANMILAQSPNKAVFNNPCPDG